MAVEKLENKVAGQLPVFLAPPGAVRHNLQLAKLVVEHVGDMPTLTAKVLEMGVSVESFIVWMSSREGTRAIREIREGFNEVLINMLTTLLNNTYTEIVDRVQNGDVYIDRETREQYRQPLRSTALVNVFDKVFEKRNLLERKDCNNTINQEYSEDGLMIPVRGGDSESLARAMRDFASRGGGLLVRKRTQEVVVQTECEVSID